MILDGATLDPTKLPKYDICIVGAGAVGIAIAYRLRDERKKDGTPLQVVVLESGVKNIQNGNSDDLHRCDSDKRWTDPIVKDLDLGNVNTWTQKARGDFLTSSRTRAFGGSTQSLLLRSHKKAHWCSLVQGGVILTTCLPQKNPSARASASPRASPAG